MEYSISYVDVLFRTILSVILGGLIGYERQSKHRPAGFRTHILVCLGSMTVMLLSEIIFNKYYVLYNITIDPTRMGAQVVSGIGFLGAGSIIRSGYTVKGLTTAAGLWLVAAIGLVVGAGFYGVAIIISVVLYIILFSLNKISIDLNRQGNVLEMKIELLNKPKTIGLINIALAKYNATILDMSFINQSNDRHNEDIGHEDIIIIKIVAKIDPEIYHTERDNILNTIRDIDGVTDVERV